MSDKVIAILPLLLVFAVLAAPITYYVLDSSSTFRELAFMRSLRVSLEATNKARVDVVDFVKKAIRRTLFILLGVALFLFGLVVMLAVFKWSIEELAK